MVTVDYCEEDKRKSGMAQSEKIVRIIQFDDDDDDKIKSIMHTVGLYMLWLLP